MEMVLIDKVSVLEKARKVAGNSFGVALMLKLIQDAPEVKRSGQVRCRNCLRNGTSECPFDKRVEMFRDDNVFYCSLGKRADGK